MVYTSCHNAHKLIESYLPPITKCFSPSSSSSSLWDLSALTSLVTFLFSFSRCLRFNLHKNSHISQSNVLLVADLLEFKT